MNHTISVEPKAYPAEIVVTQKKKYPIQYKKNLAPANIQHPYALTEQLLAFNFSIHEWRVLLRILQLIKSHQNINEGVQLDIENNVQMTFKVSMFMKDGHKNHNQVKQSLLSLREKTLSHDVNMEIDIDGVIQKVDMEQFVGVIEKPAYAHNNSFVVLQLSDIWYRYLSDLTRGYTQYAAQIAFDCSSSNTLKVYLFINHWYKSKGKKLTIDNFRKEFNISKSYSIKKIVDRFLNPAKKELDILSDRSFNYTIFYTDGIVYDQKNPIKGKRIGMISLVFYTNFKNKSNFGLTDHEHKEVEKWLKILTRRYTLTEEENKILYVVIRKYGYGYMFGIEKDKRSYLKRFTGKEFINKFADFVRKEKK